MWSNDKNCNVLDLATKLMYSGYHEDNFIDLTRDEINLCSGVV